MPTVTDASIRRIGELLLDPRRPMKERFRALFSLRNLGGAVAVECIAMCFTDSSALLKHECAYCLGQMQDTAAIPYLTEVLKDKNQEPIVRHEAGEALGAIGTRDVLSVLKEYCNDSEISVAETCQIACERMQWLLEGKQQDVEIISSNPYLSVDPAPPTCETDSVTELKRRLLDESLPLYDRYRAMFALRNKGGDEAVLALAEGFKGSSALFRHEIAYVLGQIQSPVCVPQLTAVLQDLTENEMVRHECAEALGSIAAEGCTDLLQKYLNDEKRVVRESCVVALDMCDYENSEEFQYANALDGLKE